MAALDDGIYTGDDDLEELEKPGAIDPDEGVVPDVEPSEDSPLFPPDEDGAKKEEDEY